MSSFHCGACGREVQLGQTARRLRERVESGDMPFAMIECPVCGDHTPLGGGGEAEQTLECPMTDCPDGIVSHVDHHDPPFWGCGECGRTWPSRAAVEAVRG